MKAYLPDTNVLSELRKKPPRIDPQVSAWWATISTPELYLSVLVIGELRRGVANIGLRDRAAAQSIEAWVNRVVAAAKGRILPVNRKVAERWGRLQARDPLPVVDGLLAATALEHGLTLVTRNVSDVARTGVDLLNPFDASR